MNEKNPQQSQSKSITPITPSQVLRTLPTEKLKNLLTLLEQKSARGNLPMFLRQVLRMSTPKHVMEWSELVMNHKKRLVVEASRDHGKSHFFSYGYPLWLVNRIQPGEGPIFIALGSYSEEQACKNLKKIRNAIEDTPCLKWLMPKKKGQTWDTGELNTSNGCIISTFGVGSSVRGGHYHHVIFDDPSKDHWTTSLEQQKNFLFGVVTPAVRRSGQLLVCGTPVDLQDILWVLEENPKFPVFKYPALNEQNEPLWSEQYTYEDLMERKEMIGNYLFSREYMLKRLNSEDAQFKSEWIKYYTEKPQGTYYRIMSVDPCLEGRDHMGIVVTDTNEKMETYVVFSGRFKGTVQENIEVIFEKHSQFAPDVFGIETFVFQKMMKLWIEMEQEKRGVFFPIVELEKEGVRKTYKARVMSLQPRVQAGKIMFREGQDDNLVAEMLNWDPDSKTNTDDIMTALAHQVPLLDRPYGESPKAMQTREGTFQEAFDALTGSAESNNFESLWGDMVRRMP